MTYYNGHASNVAVAGAAIALTIASSMTVVSRVGTRVFIAHCFGIEDILISFAFAFAIALCVFTVVMTLDGLGSHTWDLEEPFKWLISLYHSLWIYYLAMFCTKFSILIQYNRIFPRKEFRYATYTLMSIIGAHTIWAFFSAIFTCVPVSRFWDPLSTTGGCIPIPPLWYANAGINIATDIAIVVLPLPIFKALDLPPRSRLGLMAVFGFGAIVCIISIIRLPALHAALNGSDLLYDYAQTAIWNCAEVNIGVMCSCVPTLRALVSKFWPGAFSTRELKDITSTANAARFLEIESDAGTTTKSMSRSTSRSRGIESRSSDRLAAVLGNREILSHATYLRTDQNRLTATEEDLVHVTVPTAVPPHARVHVLTVVDDDDGPPPMHRASRSAHRHFGNGPLIHQISSPIMEEPSPAMSQVGPPPVQYRRDGSNPGNRTMFRSLSTADEIAAMERAAAQLDQAVSRAASDESINDTVHTDNIPPSYYYRQAEELTNERWSPDGREVVHPAQRVHPAEREEENVF